MTDLNKGFKTPLLPSDVPFSEDQKQWLGGFLAGLHSRLNMPQAVAGAAAQAEAPVAAKPITIIYGSQTGNAETCAYEAADAAQAAGMTPNVMDMDDVSLAELAQAERILVCTSTYGEGEMPDNAQSLWDEISADDAPSFSNSFFSVLALGDTGYDGFCVAGIMWDERLEQLGATRIAERVDCDVDYEDPAAEWTENAIAVIATKGSQGGAAAPAAGGAPKKEKSKYGRKNPMLAPLTAKRRLTGEASSKEIMHFEFSVAGTGESYEAGDALNIIPRNQPSLVKELMDVFGEVAGQVCEFEGESVDVEELLTNTLEIRVPTKDFVKALADKAGDAELSGLVNGNDTDALNNFLYGKDNVDLLKAYPNANFTFEEFLGLLKPIAPRAYSIASSINAHPEEVHLTIGSVRYNQEGRDHNGVCSTFLADIANEGEGIQCYFAPNKSFAVPEDNSKDIIMVGPGTGIAPFRGFLEERQARVADGKNWLFFGDRNAANDFIYREQLEAMVDSGFLRLDLAFSRDQEEKIYVQDRMREHGAEFFQWLENGAYFYICGDAFRMAKDVDNALHELIMENGNMDRAAAEDYVNALKKAKRYVRDVY
jgi:sulfite reductase (NADPH) flavoprotein alpha-component